MVRIFCTGIKIDWLVDVVRQRVRVKLRTHSNRFIQLSGKSGLAQLGPQLTSRPDSDPLTSVSTDYVSNKSQPPRGG